MFAKKLFYIELECGCAVKEAYDDDHAFNIALHCADAMETEIVEVRLATDDDIKYVQSMHGTIG